MVMMNKYYHLSDTYLVLNSRDRKLFDFGHRMMDRVRKELLTALSPTLLQAAKCVLQAGVDSELAGNMLHHLVSLTRVCAHYQNNLMIDSIVHLLVEQTSLIIHPLLYATPMPDAFDASTASVLLRLEADSEEDLPAGNEKRLLYLYYSPLLHVLQFGQTTRDAAGSIAVAVECYKTVLKIVQEYGASIQKGYNDVVCPDCGAEA